MTRQLAPILQGTGIESTRTFSTLGRFYLATYAHLAPGGRGFAFYDDLVTEHLSPRAANRSPMTLFAFGRPE